MVSGSWEVVVESCTVCIRLSHLPDQLRLLPCALLAGSRWAGMRTTSGNLGSPACRPLRDGAFASRPCTCQALLTCIPTCCGVSSEARGVVHLWWASRRLWHRRCHPIGHWQTRVAGLLSQGLVACHIAWNLFKLLFLGCRSRQIIKHVKLMAITKVSLALGLC